MRTLQALVYLLFCDIVMFVGGFGALYTQVRRCPTSARPTASGETERICSAVAQACSWYPKRALCLQRSAALTCLLRYQGVPAELVIGAGAIPFQAHAWVEVQGKVVNDKVSVHTRYVVLERC